MSEEKRITLLQSLLKCFSDSESLIRYVVETQDKGKKVYTILSSKSVVERWKILYCKNIVSLSIARGSHSGQLGKDALSAFTRKVVNSTNKTIVDQLTPRLTGPKCSKLIAEEVEHLERTIELGVRAANSPYDSYTLKIQEDSLKSLEDVQIFFDEAVELLEQLFLASPYEIINRENEWFTRAFPKLNEEKSEHYTKDQVLSLMACALILGLNVNDVPQINSNIEEFLISVFSNKEKKPSSAQDDSDGDTATKVVGIEKGTAVSGLEEDREVLRKSTFLISRATRKSQDELVEEIEALIQSWRTSMLDVWKTFSVKQKIQHIHEDYFELLVEYDISYSKSTKA